MCLRDKVPVGPINIRRFRSLPRQQTLVTVVERRGQDRAAPAVQHGVVEAQDELEALIRPPEYVDVEQWPSFPVEDVALARFDPLRQTGVLLLRRLASQVFHFKWQLDACLHKLQGAVIVQTKSRPQDRVLLDT